MPCYSPLKGWRATQPNDKTGRYGIVFNQKMGDKDRPMDVPCGKCIGCRLEKSRQWAMRCVHEAQLHEENSFITLTYNNENLPEGANLDVKHFQDFMKRYRKFVAPKKLRFFHCGEYGENDPNNKKHRKSYGQSKLGRPHYHAIIFGHDFRDKEIYTERDGITLYSSKTLEKIWGKGFCTIGEANFETAAYCARYITKKINGELAEDHYTRIYPDIGSFYKLKPEYITMSRRPGIAAKWLEKYKGDIYPKDHCSINGRIMRPTRFYDNILEMEDPELLEKMKRKRTLDAKKMKHDNTGQRLLDKETVKKAQIKFLKRTLEEDQP